MGLQHPDHQFKSGCRLSKSDVVVSAMMSDFFYTFYENACMIKSFHMNEKSTVNKRYDLIDTLRGLEIISMIAFHTCWLINHFGMGISTETLYGTVFTIWERSICIGFITIAGFSFSLGHRHLRSAFVIFLTGAMITAVTSLFLPEIRIVFGVLTLIGSATFIMTALDKLFAGRAEASRMFGLAGAILNLAAFVITYNINKGYVGFMPGLAVELPKGLYKGYLMTFIGFTEPGFFSTDYFSILPWIFIYICGYFIHKLVKGTRTGERVLSLGIAGIKALGRHSLPVYIAHPVIIYAALYILSYMIR